MITFLIIMTTFVLFFVLTYYLNIFYKPPEEFKNFITDQESRYLIKYAKPLLEKSMVGNDEITNHRTSSTSWVPRSDPTAKKIIERVSEKTGIPTSHAENIQVVKYNKNEEYKPHHDAAFYDIEGFLDGIFFYGGPRVLTVLIYLNDEFEGGETNFPNLKLKTKPEKNKAIMFQPLNKTKLYLHKKAVHAGLPVKKGTKWIANVWFHLFPINDEMVEKRNES
jgi:prolyl 4-hydroxylase